MEFGVWQKEESREAGSFTPSSREPPEHHVERRVRHGPSFPISPVGMGRGRRQRSVRLGRSRVLGGCDNLALEGKEGFLNVCQKQGLSSPPCMVETAGGT